MIKSLVVWLGALVGLVVIAQPARAATGSKPAIEGTKGPVSNDPQSTLPRGIRNNNPGNILGTISWYGMTGTDEAGYAIFNSPENGIRAMAVNLTTYMTVRKLNTIVQIINRWAPPADNPTREYVDFVSQQTGFAPSEPLQHSVDTVKALVLAIIHFENGYQPYSMSTINEGLNRADM
jgi:hypothetical protein